MKKHAKVEDFINLLQKEFQAVKSDNIDKFERLFRKVDAIVKDSDFIAGSEFQSRKTEIAELYDNILLGLFAEKQQIKSRIKNITSSQQIMKTYGGN